MVERNKAFEKETERERKKFNLWTMATKMKIKCKIKMR